MRQQLLDPIGDEPLERVVHRLGAVLSMDETLANLAIGVRRTSPQPGDLGAALEQGRLLQVFAFRGAMHLVSPKSGGALLSVRSASRQWELPSWREHYGLEPSDWTGFREAVRDALTDGPLTITELGTAVTRDRRFRHLRTVFDEGADTLIKPLSWQGDLSLGSLRDGKRTVQGLGDQADWAGVWDLEQAGPYVLAEYFRHYGPATVEQVETYFCEGLSAGRARVRRWLADLKDRLTAVDLAGQTRYALSEDIDDLATSRPSTAIRLLPGHDQWLMGPGTKDELVVPAPLRTLMTRKANAVIIGGVVGGTWSIHGEQVVVRTVASVPAHDFADEAARLSAVLGRSLAVEASRIEV